MKANFVRDLRLQRVDLVCVGFRRAGVDLVLSSVKAKTLSQANRVCAIDWRAETLDGRENLFVQVPFDICGR